MFGRKRITCLDDVQVVGDGKYCERFAGGSICRYDNFGGGGCSGIPDVETSERKFVWNLNRDGSYEAIGRYGWRWWRTAVAATV